MNTKDINSIVKSFEEAANAHGIATEQGDYKMANKSYKKILIAINLIKAEQAIDKLILLLDNKSVGVRIWASTFMLPKYEKVAMASLKEIMNQDGIHSLTAETTLIEWQKGNLKL